MDGAFVYDLHLLFASIFWFLLSGIGIARFMCLLNWKCSTIFETTMPSLKINKEPCLWVLHKRRRKTFAFHVDWSFVVKTGKSAHVSTTFISFAFVEPFDVRANSIVQMHFFVKQKNICPCSYIFA